MTDSANVKLVRSIFAAWERGDFSSVDWADPEIEFVAVGGPDPTSPRGVAAMVEGWRRWISAWENYRAEAEEFRALDDERVLVLMRHGGRGKGSGMEIEQLKREGANVFHVRDGKVVGLALYWDREQALADLGFAPDASSPGS